MLYIKNTTQSGQIFHGAYIEPGEYRFVEKYEQDRWATDPDVLAAVNSGDVVVAISDDGNGDLSPQMGLVTLNSSSQLYTDVVSASGTVSTSSSLASTVGSMTKTMPAGDYLVEFNGSIYTGGASAVGEFGIYKNGSLVSETRRDISCNLQLLGGLVTVSLNSIGVGTYTAGKLSVNGSDVVDVRFRSVNGGTIGFKERVLTFIRVG